MPNMTKPAKQLESPTMQEVHRLQEEVERQYEKSGLSYLDWLQATEKNIEKELAEAGFEIVASNGRMQLKEISPSSKKPALKRKTSSHKLA